MPFSAIDDAYLEDFLDANEAMDVFGDSNDFDLRPPPTSSPAALREPEPERASVQMPASHFRNMFL